MPPPLAAENHANDLDLVLRNVDTELSEAEVTSALAAQGFSDVQLTRFFRTRGGEPKPLALVRVVCRDSHQHLRLVQKGVVLNGRLCAAEAPNAAKDSSAALGKLSAASTAEVDELMRTHLQHAVRFPEDVDTKIGEPGVYAYVWRGRFQRGRHVLLDASYIAIEEPPLCAWTLIMTAPAAAVTGQSCSTRSEAPAVIVCCETSDYHRVARAQVTERDLVLEIGCDHGPCCAVAARSCGAGRVLGVDLQPQSVAIARAAHPAIRFEVLDVLQPTAVSQLRAWAAELGGAGGEAAARFSVVLIDINGTREVGAVVRVTQLVLAALRPSRLVAIKSRALHGRVGSR